MAVLGYIRNKGAKIMVVMVVLGVAGFLVMDAMGPRGMAGGGALSNTLGKVNGEEITRERFNSLSDYYADRAPGVLREAVHNYVWSQLQEEALVGGQARKAGLSVTPKEMGELYLGENLSPIVMQTYGNPQTGQIDRNMIKQMLDFYANPIDLTQVDPSQQDRALKEQRNWFVTESLVRYTRLSTKYQTMLNKGYYTPSWMVEREYARNNKRLDFNYVRVGYAQIPNKEVEVTDAELEAYIKENPKKYQREASASIEYVAFNIQASPADSAKYRGELDGLLTEFGKIDNNSDLFDFVNRYDGVFDTVSYVKKEEVREGKLMSDSIFNAPVGTVLGPYMDEGFFKIARLVERRNLPDSVRVRQIMIGNLQSQEQARIAMRTLDSLKTLLQKGEAQFDSLVTQFSTDAASRDKGGDLGYVAMGSTEYGEFFEKNIFYVTEKDSFSITASQTGYHLVQVLDKKIGKEQGARIAVIAKAITPSDETTRGIRERAAGFMANNRNLEAFRKAATEGGLAPVPASGLPFMGTTIEGIEESPATAEIIRWAHQEGKIGETASKVYNVDDREFNYTKQIIVPVLVSRSPKGLASIEDLSVRAEVDRIVRNKKRVEKLKAQVQGKTTLQEVASLYNIGVETASGVRYSDAFIGNAVEHKALAAALITPIDKISGVVGGEQGMYVVSPTKIEEGMPIMELSVARRQVAQRFTGVIGALFVQDLKNNASITDNRAKTLFYN